MVLARYFSTLAELCAPKFFPRFPEAASIAAAEMSRIVAMSGKLCDTLLLSTSAAAYGGSVPTWGSLFNLLFCLCCRFEDGGGYGQQVAFWLDPPDPRVRSFFRNAVELFYTNFEFFGQDSFWAASTFFFLAM